MSPLFRPPHLLPLGHAHADQFVDRRLGRGAADWQAGSMPPSIGDEVTLVRLEVAQQPAHVPDQRRSLLLGHRLYRVQDRLQAHECRVGLAMPDQPFGSIQASLDLSPLRRRSKAQHHGRHLRSTELHGNVEPVQNPSAGQRAARGGRIEFVCTVGDGSDPLAWPNALLREEQIEALCARGNLARDIAVQGCPAFGQGCAPSNDVELSALQTAMVAVLTQTESTATTDTLADAAPAPRAAGRSPI